MKKQPAVKNKKKKKAKLKIDMVTWNTTDSDEITRRKIRAEQEKFHISNEDKARPYFSSYFVSSSKGHKKYTVETRSLDQLLNSCDCPDYRTNALGTCKHIETVMMYLRKKGARKFKQAIEDGTERIEIFLNTVDTSTIRIAWPKKASRTIKTFIEPYFSSDGSLLGDAISGFEKLQVEIAKHKKHHDKIRVSQHIQHYIDYQKINSQKQQAKDYFIKDVELGKRSMDLVKYPLLPYQQEGMLHLAFTERALLADEMGLGKTVQAIAACELLRQLRGIQRVLVVTTASLKAEWEEQIAKFTDSPSLVIFGTRPVRLKQYQHNAFFYLMNYEQVNSDHAEIQRLLAPDVIILDEAQRIKNWRTKTANAVKELKSRYAFVLTGTPVENRIDDIYSIVQFLDPHIFGPLFRFNRDYYELDEEGRPVGYKNLDELYRRLRPIMLCRKKHDVEDELPQRLNNNYFVEMETEQRARYEEYEGRVARLINKAKRSPLRKEEFEKLQTWLACMRMICDTPFILDKDCKISPKLKELETILSELLEDPSTKIIIFSEWERMLQLVKQVADENDWQVAWHTGSVPQHKRRETINRFKNENNCRLFLSTDAGSVGLNLQVANVVINLDLPWNPAKLEQRIARAWRKYQKRSVQVINLICENSIEHRMLYLLEQKQLMAQGVLTGDEELKSMKMPSGRAAFMERMEALMASQQEQNDLSEQEARDGAQDKTTDFNDLKNTIINEFADELNGLQTFQSSDEKKPVVLAVINKQSEAIQERLSSIAKDEKISIETIDAKTLEIIQQLAKAGILTLNQPMSVLHSQDSATLEKQRRQKQLEHSTHNLSQAERKHRMADVLISGDFIHEAVAPLREAFNFSMNAFLHITDNIDIKISASAVQKLAAEHKGLTAMPYLFSELIASAKEELNVKKLHQQHQATLAHLQLMKSNFEKQQVENEG